MCLFEYENWTALRRWKVLRASKKICAQKELSPHSHNHAIFTKYEHVTVMGNSCIDTKWGCNFMNLHFYQSLCKLCQKYSNEFIWVKLSWKRNGLIHIEQESDIRNFLVSLCYNLYSWKEKTQNFPYIRYIRGHLYITKGCFEAFLNHPPTYVLKDIITI